MAEISPNGLKTMWEKEKLFNTSNFSFSHSVFKRLVLQTRKNQGLFGKGLKECRCCDRSRPYHKASVHFKRNCLLSLPCNGVMPNAFYSPSILRPDCRLYTVKVVCFALCSSDCERFSSKQF